MLYLEHFGVTDAGKVRENNEDSLLVGEGRDQTLLAVADGIGGFEAGEVASSIAVEVLKELEPGEPFGNAVREANRRILAAARGDGRLSGMGTTVVAARFSGSREEPEAEVAHVGDSRAYILRNGELTQMTEDHSLVAELVRSGDLTRDQAAEHPQKNLITRALGATEEVEADTTSLPVEAGDRLLLCSDGLTDMIRDGRIESILSESPEDPEPSARRLVSAALEAGGNDNITVVVADVRPYESREEPPAGRSGDTSEMEAVAPPATQTGRGASGKSGKSRKASGKRGENRRESKRIRRRKLIRRALAWMVRAVAVLLVVGALLSPVYLWGNNRYYLDYEGEEVVIYRGLPYSVGQVELHQRWKGTGLKESDLDGPYKDQIRNHKLYTKDQVEQVIRDLEG